MESLLYRFFLPTSLSLYCFHSAPGSMNVKRNLVHVKKAYGASSKRSLRSRGIKGQAILGVQYRDVLTRELNFVTDPETGALVGLPDRAVADAAGVVGHAHVGGRVVLHLDRGGDSL